MASLVFVPAAAQKPGQKDGRAETSSEERVQKQLDRLSTELSLTDSQRAEIEPILLEAVTRMGDLREQYGPPGEAGEEDRKAAREAVREIHKSTSSQLSAILDAEQMKDYRELQRQHREKMRERRGNGERPSRIDT
jgi:Spy/CpxP family protein refolding chaperone